MRMRVRLPKVEPDQYDWPTVCPHAGCGGQRFKAHGVKGERKPLRDSRYEMVRAYRRKCLRCGGSHRTYPRGVSADQQSDRLKGLSVLLYVLGLSYGGIEDLLSALGMCVGKTTVYENVQEAGVASRRLQREELSKGGPREVIGSDGTYLKVKGTMVNLQVVVDDRDSDLLSLDIVVSENAEEVAAVVRGVAEVVGAEVLVSDGLDTYKKVADNLGLAHQICRNHTIRTQSTDCE